MRKEMFKILRSSRRLTTVSLECQCKFSGESKIDSNLQENLPTLKKSEPKATTKTSGWSKQELQWRTLWHEKEGQQMTFLRTFYKDDNNVEILKFIQKPIDLSPKSIKKWWNNKKEMHDAFLQQYIPERHQILGPELATAHFIVHRGGAVKFHNEDKWIKAVNGEYKLPSHYQKGMYLQAIDCTDMNLYYEGLENLRNLQYVEWLSMNGCKRMDDFCMDVISNIFSHSLVYLDLRNCLNITEKGIGALYKMRNLKILYLDDFYKDTKYELTTLLLQELNPELDVRSDVINFEIK